MNLQIWSDNDAGYLEVKTVTVLRATCVVMVLTIAARSQGLSRQPGEIAPTPEMLASAKLLFRDNCDANLPYGRSACEYHFRKMGGLTWACAYHTGGNGGFCIRTPLSLVRKIDAIAEDFCEHSDDAPGPPHALTGEAIVRRYKCENGYMKREPYANEFDMDGWMLSEWKPLPN